MKSHNIYGIGAPKSGGTSLAEWLNLNAKMRIHPHDAIATENRRDYPLNPNSGEVWTGGIFWLARCMQSLDPSGLQILPVRHTIFDWLRSFWAHFHVTPKFGPGRIMALHPQMCLNNGDPIAGPDYRPRSSTEEEKLLHHALSISKIFFKSGEAPCLGIEGLEEILRAYVPHHVDLAQRTDNDDKYMVINIAEGLTPTGTLHDWLSNYVPMSDSPATPWPHKRKTTEGARKASQEEFPNIENIIRELCEPYEKQWQEEVISRVLTGESAD